MSGAQADHRTARRARKSKAFFARRALAAAERGDLAEAARLTAWALRKRAMQSLAVTLTALAA